VIPAFFFLLSSYGRDRYVSVPFLFLRVTALIGRREPPLSLGSCGLGTVYSEGFTFFPDPFDTKAWSQSPGCSALGESIDGPLAQPDSFRHFCFLLDAAFRVANVFFSIWLYWGNRPFVVARKATPPTGSPRPLRAFLKCTLIVSRSP